MSSAQRKQSVIIVMILISPEWVSRNQIPIPNLNQSKTQMNEMVKLIDFPISIRTLIFELLNHLSIYSDQCERANFIMIKFLLCEQFSSFKMKIQAFPIIGKLHLFCDVDNFGISESSGIKTVLMKRLRKHASYIFFWIDPSNFVQI